MNEQIDIKRWRKYGHRNRRSRYKQVVILNLEELAEAFGCEPGEVEAKLIEQDIPFHRDSLGNVWASVEM